MMDGDRIHTNREWLIMDGDGIHTNREWLMVDRESFGQKGDQFMHIHCII